MSEWIKCSERLPDKPYGWTMVYGCILSRWMVQPGFYDHAEGEWVSRFISTMDEGYAPLEAVTHWQPLPEPPKEEK